MKIIGEAKVSLHLVDMDKQEVNNLYYGVLNIREMDLSQDEKDVLNKLTKAVGKCVNTLNQENGVQSLR